MAVPFQKHTSRPVLRHQLNDVIPEYRTYLENQDLAPSWIDTLVGTARHIVRWLSFNGIEIEALDIRKIAGFMSHDCTCPSGFQSHVRRSRSRADRFLTYLMDAQLVEMPMFIVQGGEHVDAFISSLSGQGYSGSTMLEFRRSCRHFIVWLYLSDLALDQIDDGVVQSFLGHDCACACPHFFKHAGKLGRSSSGFRKRIVKFADFLVREGVIGYWRETEPPAARSDLVDGFLDWMRRHRGARETTIQNYDRYLHRILLPDLGDDPAAYDVVTIRNAFANWAQVGSSGQLANLATAMRAYLRYLGANGICRPGLVAAVPTVRQQPTAALPRYVSEADIEALIASCDTDTPVGMRDHAIMLLLARLALRAGDIAALRLDDIDWEQARIHVNGKSRQRVALPLPQDAGNALKIYILEGRPHMRSEFVFLGARAPYHALSCGSSVSPIVRRAMKRAGIDAEGLPAAHLFRHSRATGLLRGGASLETVATLLRHQSVETTTLYARVDRPILLEVAQPWPGDAP